jgi:hypothetical protein
MLSSSFQDWGARPGDATMKMPTGAALRALVRQGVNLELDAKHTPSHLALDLLQLGGSSHFVIVDAGVYSPQALEQLGNLGHSRITFRFWESDTHGA